MKKITYLLLLVAGTFLMACSNDDDFSTGTPAGVNNQGVFFYGNIQAQYIIGQEPTVQDTLWFEVMRPDKGEATDVPLIIEQKSAIINIADPIHFEKGDTIDSLGITYVGLGYQQEATLDFRIADEFANPYMDKDGTTRLCTSIFRSKWINVCDTLFISSQADNWEKQGCMLQQLDGKNQFRIVNFLNSGKNLEFNLSTGYNKDSVQLSKGEINPTSNYYDTGGEYWYYTNGGDYDEWTMGGSSMVVNWVEFYKGSEYTYIDMQCNPSTADTISLDGKKYLCDGNNHYSMMAAWFSYQEPYDGKSGWDYIYFWPYYLIQEQKK